MNATFLHEKATELGNRISNPNLCHGCGRIDGSLRVLALFAAFPDGRLVSCNFLVCELCYANGAPNCHKMLEFACKYCDPHDAEVAVPIAGLEPEPARDIVLFAYEHALLGGQPYV
jgi:hypothetical protein